MAKMLSVFPLSNEVLEFAPMVKPSKRTSYSISQVLSLANALGYQDHSDDIEDEWLELLTEDEVCADTDIEEYWGKAATSKPHLSTMMMALMSVPHSNAASERLFSMLKKVYSDERSQLGQDTLTSLLSVKVNMDGCCYDTKYDDQLLCSIKKAAMNHNMQYEKPE